MRRTTIQEQSAWLAQRKAELRLRRVALDPDF